MASSMPIGAGDEDVEGNGDVGGDGADGGDEHAARMINENARRRLSAGGRLGCERSRLLSSDFDVRTSTTRERRARGAAARRDRRAGRGLAPPSARARGARLGREAALERAVDARLRSRPPFRASLRTLPR